MIKQFENIFVPYEELYDAYLECRKRKRGTYNALEFEINANVNLYKLWVELNDRTYQIGKSIVFCVDKPVIREVFAADFRDRIVHHLVIRRLLPIFEQHFIEDSYSCRKSKGTLYGIRRLDAKIKEATNNYTTQATIIKCDIKSFFMSINKDILYDKLSKFISVYYEGDVEYILWLIKLIIYNEPQNNCIRKQHISHWDGLPSHKSLFSCPSNKGLPIGNLTSQIFANFLLIDFDLWCECISKYYGRYVDDFYLIFKENVDVQYIVKQLQGQLDVLGLKLHPNKTYSQPYQNGIKFIGAVVKPGRIYISNRTKEYLSQVIKSQESSSKFISSINSYLGQMIHFNTYRLRQKMLGKINNPSIFISANFNKINCI